MTSCRQSERGFTMIAVALSIVGIIAMLGVAIDFGRAFIVRNEVQTFTDSAALAAARELDGTSAGISAAREAVASNLNTWNMASRGFADVVTEFSADLSVWTTTPVNAAPYKYVRVTAPNNSITIYFLSLIGGGQAMRIAARTTAGVSPPSTYSQGLFPFAPIAHNPNPPYFGYTRGDELTLLWPSSIGSNGNVKMNNLCQSDRNQAALNAVRSGTTSDRGYIQETSASAIAAAIEDDRMDYTVSLDMPVSRSGGVKSSDVNESLANRVAQDTSPDTDNFSSYVSSHSPTPLRRLVVVPIIGDAQHAVVVGFANVFLPSSQPRNPNDAKCAMYVGPARDPVGGNQATGNNIVRILE